MDKCEHIWLYIGSKRQQVWRCTRCDEYRIDAPTQKRQEVLEAMQGAYVKTPSGSYTSWENTMCNVLGDMRTQTQNAWHDGYASAKAEREWQELTDEEIKSEWLDALSIKGETFLPYIHFARVIEQILREKNA
jgi:hypothetical protein